MEPKAEQPSDNKKSSSRGSEDKINSFPTLESLNTLLEIRAESSKKPTYRIFNEKSRPSKTTKELIEEQKLHKLKYQNDALKTENDNLRSDQTLKRWTLIILFIFLFAETTVLFVITFLQGYVDSSFDLDSITLRIVVVATLAQISGMLTFAVRHLFPSNGKEKKS